VATVVRMCCNFSSRSSTVSWFTKSSNLNCEIIALTHLKSLICAGVPSSSSNSSS
jgi:hypothetical protein